MIKLRDYPQIPLPMRPPSELVREKSERRLAENLREAANNEREVTVAQRSAALRLFVEESGGTFLRSFAAIGWVLVELPAASIPALAERQDIEQISNNHDSSDEDLGDRLGNQRIDARLGAEQYWGLGFSGQQQNPSQHSEDHLVAAVVEANYMENHSPCFLMAGFVPDCNDVHERLVDSYNCHTGTCVSSLPFSASDRSTTTAFHGTAVSSIILGDYLKLQGALKPLGNPLYDLNQWLGGHSLEWMTTSTGMAPDAMLRFFGGTGGCVGCYADAYQRGGAESDVMNMSHSYGVSTICYVNSVGAREDALSDAYDNGVFLVASAGNSTSSTCNIRMPAVMPRVFAVNGLGSNTASCRSDYSNCPLSTTHFTTGGAERPDGKGGPAPISVIDAAGPAHIRRSTLVDSSTNHGRVSEGSVSGTSFAAPLLSGLSLLVKGYLIDNESLWVNNPGRMHALMLGMSDRWHANSNGCGSRIYQRLMV